MLCPDVGLNGIIRTTGVEVVASGGLDHKILICMAEWSQHDLHAVSQRSAIFLSLSLLSLLKLAL